MNDDNEKNSQQSDSDNELEGDADSDFESLQSISSQERNKRKKRIRRFVKTNEYISPNNEAVQQDAILYNLVQRSALLNRNKIHMANVYITVLLKTIDRKFPGTQNVQKWCTYGGIDLKPRAS